jgi:GNAT superfamily N-acetyltransferase
MIEIAFLADYLETIPTLAQWFRTQWPEYYAARTLRDIAQDLYLEANRTDLPVRLVAFADGELVGTITLRVSALRAFPEYTPGLGGLFVVEQYRGQGLGTKLVSTGMNLARELGYAKVFTATVAAKSILLRLGWQWIHTVAHGDEQLELYNCELEKRGPVPQQEPVQNKRALARNRQVEEGL